MIQEDIESSLSGPKFEKKLMVRRTICNKGSDEEPILKKEVFSRPYVRWLENIAK